MATATRAAPVTGGAARAAGGQGGPGPVAVRAPGAAGRAAAPADRAVPHAPLPVRLPLGHVLRGQAAERRGGRRAHAAGRRLPLARARPPHALLLPAGRRGDRAVRHLLPQPRRRAPCLACLCACSGSGAGGDKTTNGLPAARRPADAPAACRRSGRRSGRGLRRARPRQQPGPRAAASRRRAHTQGGQSQPLPRARAEAASVEKVVTHLLRGGVAPEQVGVITPYEGQRAHVLATLARSGPLAAAQYAEARARPAPRARGALRRAAGLRRRRVTLCAVTYRAPAGRCAAGAATLHPPCSSGAPRAWLLVRAGATHRRRRPDAHAPVAPGRAIKRALFCHAASVGLGARGRAGGGEQRGRVPGAREGHHPALLRALQRAPGAPPALP